jgi:hypothetical protein
VTRVDRGDLVQGVEGQAEADGLVSTLPVAASTTV